MTRSIQPPVNNTQSSSTAEVYTSTGFNAGDLVYYQNGNYTNSAGITAPSTVSFNPSVPAPTYNPGISGSNIQNVTLTGVTGGSGIRNAAAVLTNGNIVQVYINQTNSLPYFQIVNNSTTSIVVSATQINNTYTTNVYDISVIALTGGGFVAYWLDNNPAPCFAIYTNAGAVVTAATRDSTNFAYNSVSMLGTALANGGFALAIAGTSNSTIYFRSYGSTGTPAYSWTSLTGFTGLGAYGFGLTSNSSSNIIISGPTSTNQQFQYAMYNSSGTAVVSLTTALSPSSSASSAINQWDSCTLADGVTVVFGYVAYDITNTLPQPFFKICPTTSSTITIGSDFYIPYQNLPAINAVTSFAYPYVGSQCTSVQPLSFGGFIWLGVLRNLSSYQGYEWGYAVFNSSGVCVSGLGSPAGATNGGTNAGWHIIGQQQTTSTQGKSGIVEVPSLNTAWIYLTAMDYYGLSYAQYAAQLNTTTWTLNYTNSTSQPLATVNGIPGSVNTLNSTPTKISWNGSGGAGSGKFTPGTVVVSNTQINVGLTATALNPYVLSCATNPNGNFAILYSSNSVLYANLYSPTGVLISQNNLTTQYYQYTSFVPCAKIVAMSSGKWAICWFTSGSSTALSLAIYNNTFTTQLYTSNPITTCWVPGLFGFAALTNDNLVVTYTPSSPAYRTSVAIFNNTLTQIGTTSTYTLGPSSGNMYSNCVVGLSSGGFIFGAYTSANQQFFAGTYASNSVNTYTAINTAVTVTASTGSGVGSYNLISSLTGQTYFSGVFNNYIQNFYILQDGTTSTSMSSTFTNSTYGYIYNNPSSVIVNGMTGMGTPFIFTTNGGSGGGSLSIMPFGNGTVTTLTSRVYNITSALWTNGNTMLATCPAYGYNAVICWMQYNSSSAAWVPYFSIVNAAPQDTNAIALPNEWIPTSTSTASIGVPVIPTSTSTSPSVTAVLTGVSVASASAGSTGQVAINGLTQLNSNYSSSATGAFDYTGQAVDGVKGTYNGRVVNLQGNS